MLCCLFTGAGAREIHVKPDGASSGEGATSGEAVNYTRLVAILGATISDDYINVHFAGGAYGVSATNTSDINSALSHTRMSGKTLTFRGEGTDAGPVIFDGGGTAGSNGQFLNLTYGRSASSSLFTFTVSNVIFRNFTANGNISFIGVTGAYNSVILDRVSIRNCNNTTAGATNRLLHLNNANARLEVRSSSMINNIRPAGSATSANDVLIYLGTGNSLFYNNTVSGNTCENAVYVNTITAASVHRVFNNTFYSTGRVSVIPNPATAAATFRLINNIVEGSSTVVTPATFTHGSTMIQNNIIGGYYHASGTAGGVALPDFGSDFSAALTASTAPGTQVHLPLNRANPSHSFKNRGKTYSETATETGVYLTGDQLNRPRPLSGAMSLGSVEFNSITVRDPNIYIVRNLFSGAPLQTAVEIDLRDLVQALPDEQFTFELGSRTWLGFGNLSDLSGGSQTSFTLTKTDLDTEQSATFTYSIKQAGTAIATGEITVNYVILDTEPPGYMALAAGDCFAYMGAVNFTASYRFITSYDGSSVPTGWTRGKLNPDERRMVGFSIPYVADLNRDGYPEVIGIGQTDNGTYLAGYFRYVYVYNSEGKELARMPFVTSSGSETGAFTSGGFHVSPSIGALVDSDRDGVVEIIVAFPDGGGTSALRSKAVSYNIVPSGNTYTLQYRWESADEYTRNVAAGTNGSGNFEKANPQVADLDGDGTPEVLVYNKVYNAATGALLLELESMGTGTSASTWPVAYLGCNINAPGGSANADRYVAFPYIYDMDGDEIYDIVAGGKIYRIKTDGSGANPGSSGSGFTYDIITMPGVGDGYTGVADIDGNGRADIVVVSRYGTGSTDSVVIKVWNPGFDNARTAHPALLASRNIALASGGADATGSNSHVYIGDIDGREQIHNGKTYRLPEIAVLTRRVNVAAFPRHPNIADIPAGDGAGQGGIPATYSWAEEGCIFALTYDAEAGDLKGSFILAHEDASINTGFTMFDFDNDGVQEICYRDMQTLRIIKPGIPFVKAAYTDANKPDVIKFSRTCRSYTGFEYPVIADIDNDASAEMLVVGQNQGSLAYGYIYAVGNDNSRGGDKFAPAWPVWNQFMYDPFKIKPDLTTPTRAEGLHAIDRLSPAFTFRREVKDENNRVEKVVEHYNPFNGTLLQVPYFTALPSGAGAGLNFEPIVYLPDAYIVQNSHPDAGLRPQIKDSVSVYYIEILIGNLPGVKTDIPSTLPVAVYRNNRVSKNTFLKKETLSSVLSWTGSRWAACDTTLKAGQTLRIRIPLPATEGTAESVYIIRLGDDSDTAPAAPVWRWGLNDLTEGSENPGLGIGVARRNFRDCNWDNQTVRAARYQVIGDTRTVQEFHSVQVGVWENDILPDSYFAGNPAFVNDSMKITLQPVAGYLAFSGSGRNGRIEYRHDGRELLTHGIDSFRYRIKFRDASRTPVILREDSATVYIYVLESQTGGFAACYGAQTVITLAGKPAGVRFDWYKATGDTVLQPSPSLTRTALFRGDSVYRIHPMMPAGPYEHLDFPPGQLTVSLATSSSGQALMRWTGLVNRNWKNPGNWVEVKGAYETPVAWAPTGCVDVVIPSGATRYPELTDSVRCATLTMKDRAMLRNPHVLTYAGASVELKLTPAEKDRFIMWSAPLKDMYSGDWHFKKSDGNPNWGDAYMMFFQMANPDGGDAAAHTMTATAGHPGLSLPLGTAFNFRLSATTLNRDSTLRFPKSETSYTGADHITVYPTPNRTDKSRFITDGIPEGVFDLPVRNSLGTSPRILQVVNPYMAWLDVHRFLEGNSAQLIANAYVAWDGSVNGSPVSYHEVNPPQGMRYWIPSNAAQGGASAGWIAPLKSFFVIRAETASPAPATLKMSAAWTTTAGPSDPYALRAATAGATATLYIRATQGERSGSTALRYDPQAIAGYRAAEDVVQLFYDGADGTDGVGLTLYTLAPRGEALAIHSSGDFSSRDVPLALRIREAGELRLDFAGLQGFGHDIWLVDKTLNRETDLRTTSAYTFTVAKTGNRPLDLADRFSLRLRYTGSGLTGAEPPAASLPAWTVYSGERCIHVRSGSGPIPDLRVYSVAGSPVYRSAARADYFRIPVPQGIYIVKATFGETQRVEKVIVR